MTDRLRTIGVRQIARFNDPVAVPLVSGDASISEIARIFSTRFMWIGMAASLIGSPI